MPISKLQRPNFRSFLTVIIMLGYGFGLKAQPVKFLPDTISLGTVKLANNITTNTGIFIDSINQVTGTQFQGLPALYQIPLSMTRKLQPKYVSKSIYLQFSLKNDSDSSGSIYFLPALYCNNINLFKYNNRKNLFEAVPLLKGTKSKKADIVSRLDLEPHESATYITELDFVKTSVNSISPILVREFYLPTLLSQLQNEHKVQGIISYLVCGIMLMMIFYSFGGYYTSRRLEFLFYSAYTFLLGILFFFKAALYKMPIESNYFFESYFDFILQSGASLFYFMFLQSFTNARAEFPLLNKVLVVQKAITISGMLAFTILHFFVEEFQFQNSLENLLKYTWAAGTIFFILFAITRQSKLLRYLAFGHLFLLIFGFLSLFLIISPNQFNTQFATLVNDSLFWYEMGIFLELVFFMIALSYKNKVEITLRAREQERLLIAYEKSVIEREIEILAAQQKERNRISEDMHDELGSGVTVIRLMSELAKTKLQQNTPVEIEKISTAANELIIKMNTIIWTMKSSNDSVDSMIAYVRSYTSEFLDNINLKYTVESPETINPIELSGEKRRNIFLCIKEALNNIAKHAKATTVHISFHIGPHLEITISDDGIGLNHEMLREFSNGLANMRKRMENIDGHFNIRTENGTIVTLTVPLT